MCVHFAVDQKRAGEFAANRGRIWGEFGALRRARRQRLYAEIFGEQLRPESVAAVGDGLAARPRGGQLRQAGGASVAARGGRHSIARS